MSVLHRQSNKTIRLSQPQQFLATERTIVEDAYPGDIIGVFDAGTMGVGDTLCAIKAQGYIWRLPRAFPLNSLLVYLQKIQ